MKGECDMVLIFLAALVELADFGHAQRDTVLQFPAKMTIQEGHNATLHCNFSTSYSNPYIFWYQQRQTQSPQVLLRLDKWKPEVHSGRFSSKLSAEDSQVSLDVQGAELQDSAAYFCALSPHCVTTDKLIFGSGTTLTVEPDSTKSSDPEVIVMKSKKPNEDGSTGKAACLARNFNTKNIILDMSSDDIVYHQKTPILTSKWSYNTIKVVKVTNKTEVTCVAKSNNNIIGNDTAWPEKESEEPVRGEKVCNITDTPAQDTKVEKANMLSMAVLGLRVLLAKSIAFNTLMSIKLFLF
ncbi:T cell receptor alpha chain MC.7.G5-like [Phalacrocorax aristotelis]|uniref:T cell receptor alpha chain MC.7.G5-like n=1 Tax=Phalacrocorax aristotelis TaxID=126867 RepID=UPI003F4B5F21